MPMDLSLAAIGLNTQQNVLAQILGGAEFVSDMLYTAVPRVAAAGTTATFTRATTGSVQDHEGVLRTAIAGEARFTGARRVRNLLPSTEGTFDAGAGWTVLNGTVTPNVSDPNGGTSAYTLRQTGASSCELYPTTPFSGSVLSSVWLRRRTGTGAIYLYGGDTETNITDSVTSEWQRIPSHPTNSSAVGFDLRLFDANDEVDFWRPQAEDITGRADPEAPSEYVSVGVLSAPYHGSMVDGVKYFDTDISGNPIPSTTLLGYLAEGARTNLCLQSNSLTTTPWADQIGTCTPTQNATGPNGGTTAWTLTDNDGAATEVYGANVGVLTAENYTASIFVAKTSGAQSSYPVFLMYDGTALRLSAATIDTTNGIATIWTSYTGWTAVGTADCVSHNDYFWRVSVTFTASTNVWVINLAPAGALTATLAGPAYDAAAQGSAVFYGAQVELGSFASSYIPTTTIAVARNADVLTYSSAGNIDGTKGWCYAEFDVANDSDGNQNIILGSDVAGVFPLYAQPSLGNVRTLDGINAPIARSAPMSGIRKGVGTWGGSTLQCAHNGVVSTTTAFDGNMNVTSVVRVGEDNAGNSHLFGTIRNVRIGQRQLSASELQAITS